MSEKNSFLGIGWSFPPKFNRMTNGLEMVSEEEDIQQSLYILLSTYPGERMMDVKFGCALRQFVYEEINQTLFTHMKMVISRAIKDYEARIDLNDVLFDYEDQDGSTIYITIDYTIRQTNSRHNMVYPFYRFEGTNIKR